MRRKPNDESDDALEAVKESIIFEKEESGNILRVIKGASAMNDYVTLGSDKSMKALRVKVSSCTRCVLHKSRTQTVFGTGNWQADLVFVGEAPGRDEDLKGEPFVGRAGQLLTKIIEAMSLKREDVFICNILKCRPPKNRNPEPDEIAQCQDYLRTQIHLINPKVICTLGKFASQTLLESETPISKLRGVFHDYHGIKLMPTYHPAYLLRNPKEKRLVWEDMQKAMKELAQ